MWQHYSPNARLKVFFESHPDMVTFPCKAFMQLFASNLSHGQQYLVDAEHQ